MIIFFLLFLVWFFYVLSSGLRPGPRFWALSFELWVFSFEFWALFEFWVLSFELTEFFFSPLSIGVSFLFFSFFFSFFFSSSSAFFVFFLPLSLFDHEKKSIMISHRFGYRCGPWPLNGGRQHTGSGRVREWWTGQGAARASSVNVGQRQRHRTPLEQLWEEAQAASPGKHVFCLFRETGQKDSFSCPKPSSK